MIKWTKKEKAKLWAVRITNYQEREEYKRFVSYIAPRMTMMIIAICALIISFKL